MQSNDAKNKVNEIWQNAFPELTFYAKGKFYKKLGPIIMGLELVQLPRSKNYRPYFVMYPLWKADVKSIFEEPIILEEFYNARGGQYSISYENLTATTEEVLDSVRKRIPLKLQGDVALNSVFLAIDRYAKESHLSAAPTSYLQAKLFEAKLYLSLYIDVASASILLDKIRKINWDQNHFKAFNVEVDKWISELKNVVENRNSTLIDIAANKNNPKLSKITTISELLK